MFPQCFKRPLTSVVALLGTMAATTLYADEVTLISTDGTIDIRGELIGFSDNVYTIATDIGDLNVAASGVRCEGAACPNISTEDIDVSLRGSDTIGVGLMPLLLEGYAENQQAAATVSATARPGELRAELVADDGFGDDLATLVVTSTSSNDAFEALLQNETDIAISARRIRPEEARALRDVGAGNMVGLGQEHIIAVDSLVTIVHPDNPVQSITVDQLMDIYSNEIRNWAELGGPDEPIIVMHRRLGTGTREVFVDRVFDGEEPYLPWSTIADDSNEMAALVNNARWSIGYVGFAFQRGAKALTLVNECGISMFPNAFSARTEEYALQRRLYAYTRADVEVPAARDLIDYMTSVDTDAVVAKAGFIGLGIDRREQSMSDDRAQLIERAQVDSYERGIGRDMLDQMVQYDRLSTTFRFRTGSSRLDERGQVDLERLVEYLQNVAEGAQVQLVGFTDSVGSFDANLALSRDRSQQILEDVQITAGDRLSGLSFAASGYSEISPAACNSTDAGRRINRRVEVWIKEPS
jgi:phosphate transport system substrate-binding protein